MDGRGYEMQSCKLGLGDGGRKVLALLVLGEVGEDEPGGVNVEPSQGILLTHKLIATVETGTPRGVDENVATLRRYAEPHMFFKGAVWAEVRGTTALTIDETGLDPDCFTEAIKEFAVALTHGLALAPCLVSSTDLPRAIKGDIIANPEIDKLSLIVTSSGCSHDATSQRRIVVVGVGNVIVGSEYGSLPTRRRL